MVPRVLHVLPTAQWDGTAVARMVAALARPLAQAWEVRACFLGHEGPLMEMLQAAGVPVAITHWNGAATDLAGAWRFQHLLRRERPRIVHYHAGGRLLRWLVRATTGAALVVHVHGRICEADSLDPSSLPLSGVALAVATSRAVADCVRGVPCEVVYPAVDESLWRGDGADPEPAEENVIGTAARLVPVKGIEYLIDAFELVRAAVPNARLEIAGDGPERSRLEQAAGLRGHGSIRFLGWVPDLPNAMRRWTLYAHPALEEGFGLAVLEAMASGVAVVASQVGGIREIVEDGSSGYLVPPRDPRALASAVIELLNDRARRTALARAGRERVRESFGAERMAQDLARVYQRVVSI